MRQEFEWLFSCAHNIFFFFFESIIVGLGVENPMWHFGLRKHELLVTAYAYKYFCKLPRVN